MFENLTNKFEEIFSSLKKAPSLNENQVDEGLRKIRQALLEADVALPVAKELIKNIKPKAIGQEIIRSTTPGQMIIKVVFDEILKILGDTQSELNLNAVPPVCLVLVGLQGSGKTTTAAKLAKYLEQNNKKKSLLVSLDVYRPAAQEQLSILGEKNSIQSLPIVKEQLPLDIVRNGSRGLYWLEPLIEIDTCNGRLAFGPVTSDKVDEFITSRFWERSAEHPLYLGPTEDIPYLKTPQRVTFARVGFTDPL